MRVVAGWLDSDFYPPALGKTNKSYGKHYSKEIVDDMKDEYVASDTDMVSGAS